MKFIFRVIFLVLMTSWITQTVAQEYVIRFAHVVASNTPKGRAANLFAEKVNNRLAGKVRVEVYPNSELYDDDMVLTSMLLNDSEQFAIMAAPSLSKFLQFSQQLQVFDLPFLFQSMDEVHQLIQSPLAEKLTAPLEDKGIKALAFWDNDMKVFSVRGEAPLRKVPDDFQGKRFRIQNSDVHAAMIEALGGIPQRMPFRVVHLSLEKEIVDGQENTWSNIFSQDFYKVQDWITVSNHSYLGYLVVISEEFWNSLPDDIRQQLAAALKEATEANRRFAAEEAIEDRQKVEAAGYAQVVELTSEEREKWRQATQPVETQFAPEIGPELLADIHKLLGH